ncbi:ABC transporter ATP-binding protein [Cellulomonas hominis]|uniref:ABC transporter ATP-binding protein n=1 Tax=Cellulomonas hominis TaxID=156981 RepID=UPI001B9BD522|nr:ABC transporter ATP-binding protein [Cellulomonas hominis]VTR75293.1 SkfA peptide export ATP-binding protein SkfE [Cellulomonas hominis]
MTQHPAAPGLVVEGLEVRLGRRRVLDGVQLTLPLAGQVVGLFGPNGAGKTTLMKCVVGLLQRYRGHISVAGGGASYMPDSPYLYPFLRVSECEALFRSRYADFSAERAEELFTALGLDRSRRMGELSKGMSEQVHVALTFARQVPLYVLDEPLAAVDPYTRELLLDVIQRLRPARSTTLISTHIIQEVADVFDEVIMLSDGRVVRHDLVAQLPEGAALEELYKKEMAARWVTT